MNMEEKELQKLAEENLKKLGIRCEDSWKEVIDEITEKHTHQGEVITEIYKLVFPLWDNIDKIKGWPKCSKNLWQLIMRKIGDFDKKHHPTVMAGGCWMNSGWSTLDKDVPEWGISMKDVSITLKMENTTLYTPSTTGD